VRSRCPLPGEFLFVAFGHVWSQTQICTASDSSCAGVAGISGQDIGQSVRKSECLRTALLPPREEPSACFLSSMAIFCFSPPGLSSAITQ